METNIDLISNFTVAAAEDFGTSFLLLLVGLSYQKAKKIIFCRKIKKAFGFSVSDGKGFAISLPFWTLIKTEREIPRFAKKKISGEIEKYYGPTDTFSVDDTIASNEVAAIFSTAFHEPPTIIPDNAPLSLEDKTIIMIGSPVVNFHARSIFKNDLFELGTKRPFVFCEQEESRTTKARSFLVSNRTGKEYHSTAQHDMAVVQRIKNPRCEDGYVFALAAAHAEGTLGAAKFLQAKWEFFSKVKKNSCAGVLIKVDRDNPENYLVQECYPIDFCK